MSMRKYTAEEKCKGTGINAAARKYGRGSIWNICSNSCISYGCVDRIHPTSPRIKLVCTNHGSMTHTLEPVGCHKTLAEKSAKFFRRIAICKKVLFARLGVATLALTMVTTCLMGGTLAKYTSLVTGNGSVTAAKFDFNKNTSATWATQTTLGATANVGYADTGIELYPGQTGTITLPYHFESDVDAVYTPGFNVEGAGVFAALTNYDKTGSTFEDIDLTFTIEDSAAQAGSPYIAGNTTKIALSGLKTGLEGAFKAAIGADESNKIDAATGVKDGTITIKWAWADGNNAVDTLNGLAATGMYVKTTDRTIIDATAYNLLTVEDKANYTQITGVNDVTVTLAATIAQDAIS